MATSSGRGKRGKRGGVPIGEVLAGGAGLTSPLVDFATRLPPGVFFRPDPVGNLFDTARAGRPVVRPDDLLALRVQLINLTVVAGDPPRLRRSGTAAAYLVLHYPPQSIAEEVFYEAPPAHSSDTNPDKPPPVPNQPAPQPPGNNSVDPPPVRARAAGESRVVFEWPSHFEADYTVAGLMDAAQQLAMKVPRGAKPRQSSAQMYPWWPGALLTEQLERVSARRVLTSSRTLALGSTSLRQASIAFRGGPAAQATLTRRLLDVSPGLAIARPIGIGRVRVPHGEPEPAPPAETETALELPWRLIVSPHAGEHWRHAAQAVTSPATNRTELWHSRLVGSDASGQAAIEPPHPDASRTIRAVWATTGFSGRPMQSKFPTGITEVPLPGAGDPFLTTLSDYDRYQVSHLSANFGMSNYQPQPVDARLLMLSALGGWLDSRAHGNHRASTSRNGCTARRWVAITTYVSSTAACCFPSATVSH